MSVKRIAILSVHASPLAPMGGSKTGGMNVYIRKLAQEMGQRGIAVDIYTRRTSSQQPTIDSTLGKNVQVIHVNAGGIWSLGPDDLFPHLSEFGAGVIAHATRHNIHYDLIYSHYWLSGWVAHCLKEVWGIPFVHMFHTLGQMKNRVASSAQNTTLNQRVRTESQIVKWADAIIAATPAEYAQLRWLYRVARRKISIVSPGVDLEQFRPIAANVAKAYLGLPPQVELLLFVGRIEPLKAVDTIIQALAIIRDRQPAGFKNVRFIVVGGDLEDPSDTEMARLQSLVAALDLQDSVTFVGAREQSELRYYYAAALAVIMPSDYESFGMVALESMATGTPVIASEVGGLAFLIRDGETGFHVPVRDREALAERICELLQSPDKLVQMRKKAVAIAHQYAWSTIADKLFEVFDSILTNRRVSHHTH